MSIPTKIFIIPYRDRATQKHFFETYIKYILEDIPAIDYKIFFIHQNDKRPFNRGAMKNIGFLSMKAKYPNDYKNITFIFNDIDTIPYKKNLLKFDTDSGIIKHFYGFNFALGGIFSIKGADFEKCGGFPNYWGWGLEDNDIHKRVLNAGLKINRDNFYLFLDRHIIHINDNVTKIHSKQDVSRHINNSSDTINDIKNLVYTINDNMIDVTNFTSKYHVKNEQFYNKHYTENFGVIKNFDNNNKHSLSKFKFKF